MNEENGQTMVCTIPGGSGNAQCYCQQMISLSHILIENRPKRDSRHPEII